MPKIRRDQLLFDLAECGSRTRCKSRMNLTCTKLVFNKQFTRVECNIDFLRNGNIITASRASGQVTFVCLLFIMTSSKGNISRVTGHLCGEFTGHRWIPAQRPVTRSFDVFFDLLLNKRLSKQSWGCWFETPLRSLWRHCNVYHHH